MRIKDIVVKSISIERKLDLKTEPPLVENMEVGMKVSLESEEENKLLLYVSAVAEAKSFSIETKLYVEVEGEKEELKKAKKALTEKETWFPELDEILGDIARRIVAIEVMLSNYMKLPLQIPMPKHKKK